MSETIVTHKKRKSRYQVFPKKQKFNTKSMHKDSYLCNTDSGFIRNIVHHTQYLRKRLRKLLAMTLSNNHIRIKTISLVVIVVLAINPIFMTNANGLQLTNTSEYTNYVHTYLNSTIGNYTYVEKPMFPVLVNNSQIPIGGNWTIICPLQANHNYHVYFYGAYINISSAAKTDYDVYVYDPAGNLESTHTEAAGLPEHLGTNTSVALFTPNQSGNWSFVIKNNPVDSMGTQQATFMIIETLQTDQWYTTYVEGTNDNNSRTPNTAGAVEFVTNASYVSLFVKVANTLDMYEARLYLMNNAQSPTLNDYPLPWEPGLYGNLSSPVGGYNFDSNAYRGVAYASCEYMGEPMFLNYTASGAGPKLYHLVLIGEKGGGDIEYILKTNFDNRSLTPLNEPVRISPNNSTELSFVANGTTPLETAEMSYTTDNWTSTNTIDMAVSNQTCNATIPGQESGTAVQYRINATDVLENTIGTSGNYTVKEPLTLNIMPVKDRIPQGANITIYGKLTPSIQNVTVEVQFCSTNSTQIVNCTVNDIGNFTAIFKPGASGLWSVAASLPETQTSFRSDSDQLTIMVTPPPFYVKYILFIVLGFVGAIAAGAIVYFLKFRNK